MTVPVLTNVRARSSETAIVFVHGYGGDPTITWSHFPAFLKDDNRLGDWDIHTIGYSSRLIPDLVGIWTADGPLPTLALLLKTALDENKLGSKGLVLIAHSMGGLIVQRALVDHPRLAARVTQVILFGTPSAGLAKARWFGFLKPQLRDMGDRSEFIHDLRARWNQQFNATAPFAFRTIAGDQDEFVPAASSLEPFPIAQQSVVAGMHTSIVKPPTTDDLGYKTVINAIMGNANPAGPRNSARVAAESRDFQTTIRLLEPNRDELDSPGTVALALAYEETGRQADAVSLLERYAAKAHKETDPLGVLAGRLKRRWLVEHRESDAVRALALYRQGYDSAAQNANHSQAFYLGINVAFLLLAQGEEAKTLASEVLTHCQAAAPGFWRAATEADANLILGNTAKALELYQTAIALNPEPRQLKSMCQQALLLAGLLRDPTTAAQIETLCGGNALILAS